MISRYAGDPARRSSAEYSFSLRGEVFSLKGNFVGLASLSCFLETMVERGKESYHFVGIKYLVGNGLIIILLDFPIVISGMRINSLVSTDLPVISNRSPFFLRCVAIRLIRLLSSPPFSCLALGIIQR